MHFRALEDHWDYFGPCKIIRSARYGSNQPKSSRLRLTEDLIFLRMGDLESEFTNIQMGRKGGRGREFWQAEMAKNVLFWVNL